ncbi:MbtH family protein [Erwinia sp. AnSW2-5]|uniref:MbtH family protein n=1 Tax=Erwinia sp. AnSW2-5 TaxID=3367692 RepID=UPI00385A5ABC
MTEQQNPFDDESLDFLVLLNARQQYSLWPAFSDVPAGWQTVSGPNTRAECIRYIEENWHDMRPAALKTAG